ncbi:6-phosphogluconolactonase [Pedobacter sp. HMF7647]|uniref:6-phosphogluconolactonase n=1 Tax=Hufsiella arboris TaxID=2695275 RepID=A0A7K1YAH1_9SPHI|nr:6-phosphogluconolactonase [Hufsiella arboris]MXV51109.1 6-phosphogluconolactonase [Hufsiella arboris]
MIRIFDNTEDLSRAAADLFLQAATESISQNGQFNVALTGGSSPVKLYQLLSQPPYSEQIQWDKVFVFWGDERWVPLDDERSNAKMAYETLLNHLPVKPAGVFPMWADKMQPAEFAERYEQTLKLHLGSNPQFDLILLGMGDDGHTASLFPGTDVLREESKLVDAYYLVPQDMFRVTLTAPVINQAKHIAVITYGEKKTNALYEVLEGEKNPEKYPSQLLNPRGGDITWFVDKEAAAKLSS